MLKHLWMKCLKKVKEGKNCLSFPPNNTNTNTTCIMSDNTYPSNNTKRDYKATFVTKVENAARRASLMDVKVFQLKIQSNHLN